MPRNVGINRILYSVASYSMRYKVDEMGANPLTYAVPLHGENTPHFEIKHMFHNKRYEIMQLIQLHSFHHGENDAADSAAYFFFHSGGAARPRRPPQNEKKRMQLNQLHPCNHENKYAAESTA